MRSILSTALVSLMLAVPRFAQAQDPQLARLAWLAGCWASETREIGSGEHWMPLAGGTMLGVGRTVKGGKTVDHEFLQIRTNSDGQVVYIALPLNQEEATFVASSITDRTAVFENLQHDFPQRVMYRLLPDERLVARIEGLRGGVQRGIDFPMKRVQCGELTGK